METRIEKYKRIRKEKRIRRFKSVTILFLIGMLFWGINIVNQTARQLNYLDNANIFNYDFKNHILELLGETYFIDFKILKKYF